jgi:mono/diheme cytochrome c family protein
VPIPGLTALLFLAAVPGPAAAAPAGAVGPALLARYECHRCHAGTGLPEPPLARRCVGCHQDIEAGRFELGPEAEAGTLAAWQRRARSLIAAPRLDGVALRLDPAWLARFLVEPSPVRPELVASMPRLGLSATVAEALSRHLTREPPPVRTDLPRGDAARGAELYRSLSCASCHRPPEAADGREPPIGARLAPDLGLSRARWSEAALASFLLDPAPSAMPDFGLDPAAAADLAAHLRRLEPRPPPPPFARRPVLRRPVGWDEVEARVFRKVCWHCHSSPDLARGDGGPGNTGGFGFEGRALDLSSYSALASGMRTGGRRQSAFARLADGTPRLLASLLARHDEVRGHPRPDVRGMPLGLPPLDAETIQLVETWIAQGRPR